MSVRLERSGASKVCYGDSCTSGMLCIAIAAAMYGPNSVKDENATCKKGVDLEARGRTYAQYWLLL